MIDHPLLRLCGGVLAREVRLTFRHGADALAVLLFFILCGMLFPLAIGPAPQDLARLGPGLIWIAALLAALLPLDRLWGADYEDGSLDQLMLMGLPPALIALTKAMAHWLTTGLPVVMVAVPLGVMLSIPQEKLIILAVTLALGTAVLSLIGTMAAAIVLGARRGGVLLPVLVLPLVAPVLIFGATGATDPMLAGLCLRVLGGFLALAVPFCAWAAGAALRVAVE